MSTEDIDSRIDQAADQEEERLAFQRRCIEIQQQTLDAYLAELKDVQEHRRKAEETSRRSCEYLEQIVQLLREAKAGQ